MKKCFKIIKNSVRVLMLHTRKPIKVRRSFFTQTGHLPGMVDSASAPWLPFLFVKNIDQIIKI